uniref:Uncharacterized protein n=1 Tax=Ditylum brightwellii TaxID=49249 RepID=A0A7S4QP31_9STRA
MAPERASNVPVVLLPSFDDFATSMIKFSLSSSLSNRMASPWCKYVANCVFERYHEIIFRPTHRGKIERGHDGLICAWTRCLFNNLMIHHHAHYSARVSSKSVKANDSFKLTPLLQNLHCHILVRIQRSQTLGPDLHQSCSHCVGSPPNTNGVVSFASVIVNLLKEVRKVCSNQKENQGHLMCLSEILKHTPADVLFVQRQQFCINHNPPSIQDVGNLAEVMLQDFGTESMTIATNIFVGLGIFVHKLHTFLNIQQSTSELEEAQERTSDEMSCVNDITNDYLSKVVRIFFVRSDLSWMAGTKIGFGRMPLKKHHSWEHFVLLVQSELTYFTATCGVRWWNELIDSLFDASTDDDTEPTQPPVTISQLSDGFCDSVTQIWSAPDTNVQVEKTKSFYRVRKKSLQKAAKGSLFSIDPKGYTRVESTSNNNPLRLENASIGGILGNL